MKLLRQIRAAFRLLRLVRRMEVDAAMSDSGTSFTLVVEGGASYDELARVAEAHGQPAPARRRGWEINYWPDVGQPAVARRGVTADEALARVLSDR